MTHLYLIRHGEAVAAATQRMLDHGPEAGLTPLGRTQATRLRDRLAATGEIPADVLIASHYTRAHETAQIIAPALGGLPLVVDPAVAEIGLGRGEGLTWTEFDARYGRPDRREPFTPLAPGGESWADFKLRAARAIHRITHTHAGQHIVVVCHGGIIESAFLFFLGLGVVFPPPSGFLIHNTSITEWTQLTQDGVARWYLARYNDDLHLRDHIHWGGVAPAPRTGADAPAAPLPAAVPPTG